MMNNKPAWYNNPIMKCVYLFFARLGSAVIEEEYNSITLHQETRLAEINFYDYEEYGILELSIVSTRTGDMKFYLHMEAVDEEDTEEAVKAFLETWNCGNESIAPLEDLNGHDLRILLVCTSGITSGLFAQCMQTMLNDQGSSSRVEAKSISELADLCPQCYDRILLTPQVGYYYEDVTGRFGNKVQKINTRDFATMNVSNVIRAL